MSPQSRVVLILDGGWLARIEFMLTVWRHDDLHAQGLRRFASAPTPNPGPIMLSTKQ